MSIVLLIPVPTLLCLVMLWLHCRLLDSLRSHELKEKQMYREYAVVHLIAVLVFTGVFISQVPELVKAASFNS